MCSFDYYSRLGACPETGRYTEPGTKGCRPPARFRNAKPESAARYATRLSDCSAGHSTTAPANATRESECSHNPG